MLHLEKTVKLFAETLADLSIEYGAHLAKNPDKYLSEDSREAVQTLIGWAEEFEQKYANERWHDKDYLTEVDKFFEQKLKEAGLA